MAPHFLKAPEVLFSQEMFHPSAAGYALVASQLLPALCDSLGAADGDTAPEAALGS